MGGMYDMKLKPALSLRSGFFIFIAGLGSQFLERKIHGSRPHSDQGGGVKMTDFVPIERIASKIYLIRDIRVMLDRDLAELYGVETKVLKQAVRRNIRRFPEDFMFELTEEENKALRSQNVTLKRGKHSKYPPFAFTEHGALMMANILKSKTAVSMSIYVVRAFIRMREELTSRRKLEERLNQIEKILLVHDTQLKELFEKIRPLLLPPPEKPRRRIGFEVKEPMAGYGKKGKKSQTKT
jgi:phage regulator Rha-like protein